MICHRESCIEFVDIYLHALKVVASMCYLFVMSDSKMILDVLLHDAMAQRRGDGWFGRRADATSCILDPHVYCLQFVMCLVKITLDSLYTRVNR